MLVEKTLTVAESKAWTGGAMNTRQHGILLRLPVKIVDWILLIAGSARCAGLFYLCTKGIW